MESLSDVEIRYKYGFNEVAVETAFLNLAHFFQKRIKVQALESRLQNQVAGTCKVPGTQNLQDLSKNTAHAELQTSTDASHFARLFRNKNPEHSLQAFGISFLH